jgi:hypothetical protein
MAFLLFIDLRATDDETAIPWQTTYVVVADRTIGFGHNPTALLQAWLRHPWVGRIASWTCISCFVAPSLVAIALWWADAAFVISSPRRSSWT